MLFAVAVFWIVFMAGVPTLLTEIGTVQPDFRRRPPACGPGTWSSAIDGRAIAPGTS